MDKLKNRAKGGRGEQKILINTSHFTLNSSLSRVSVYSSSKSETVYKILRHKKKKLKHKVTSYHEYVVRIQNGFVQILPRRWPCPRWLHRSQLHLAFSDLLLRCPQAQTSNQGGPWNDNKMLPESPTLRKECYQVDHCEFDKSQKNFHRLKHPTKVGPVLTTMHCNANHQMLPKSPKQWELFFLLVNI